MAYEYGKRQTTKDLARFALENTGWHTFYRDHATVELICAGSNLGIIKINEHGQFCLKSAQAAEQYLA